MEQQRRMLLFVTSSVAILLLWNSVVMPIIAPRPLPQPPARLPLEELAGLSEQPADALRPANVLPEVKAPPKPAGVPDHPPRTVQLGSLDPGSGYFLHVELTSLGAAVSHIELNDQRYPEIGQRGTPLRLVGHDRVTPEKTFGTQVPNVDDQLGRQTLETIHWDIVPGSQSESSVQFRIVSPDGRLELTKQYDLRKLPADRNPDRESRDHWTDGYLLKLTFTIRNLSAEPLDVRYDLRGPVGLPLEDPDNSYKQRDIRLGFLNTSGGVDSSSYTAKEAVEAKNKNNVNIWDREIQYIGVDTQFFAALVHPVQDQRKTRTIGISQAAVIKEGPKPQFADVSVMLGSTPRTLGPRDDASAALTDEFELFAGPKRQPLLAALKADPVLDYGWFAPIVVWMLWILNSLHDLGVNYGLAIIGLTCLVRAAIFPLSRYQSRSMDKMKELQPKIKVIHEKYKKNPESLSREEMRTMQEVNLKMMWGCLPLLAQMPIFFALYRALQISVDLRMAPLHLVGNWIDNLAAPDALFPFGFTLPFVGWTEFNLLPIITVVLFILNQKITMPPPADEEQALQYKMMNVMMGVMGFMFYRVPAGLCVYFITSTIWGMTERMLLKKWAATHPEKGPGTAGATVPITPSPAPKPAGGAPAKPSMFDDLKNKLRELQELADKPATASRDKPDRKGKPR